MRLYCAMMLLAIGDDRRDIMATTIQQIHPVAHLPLVLGVLRRLEVATVIDRLIPPHPAHGLSCGRGVEALVLAILDGHHALYKVGRRLEERGMVALLQPGLTRAALNDDRLGHILDALFAANLNGVFSAVALKALEIYAILTPWLHQDTTTIALYGMSEDAPQIPGAPRPGYGHSKDGRGDLKQVLLSLSVSGDGGLPLRLGMRDGHTSDSVETPVAIEECLALGLEGVQGIVADSKAYSRRTLGLCLEKGIGLVTLVPRTCAVRQELEVWGQQQPALPLLVEKPGRSKDEACRQWHGHSVIRSVEVEDSEGRVTPAEVRFLVVHSSQLAQQHTQTYASAQEKEAEALTDHGQRVHARWFACEADAAAAIAEYEQQEPGRRGRRPRPWRYHAVRYRVVADTRHLLSQAIAWELNLRRWPTRKRTMDGWCWRRPWALMCVAIPTFSKPIRTRILRSNLVFGGSRTLRPSPPCGSRNPNALRPWRCSPSSACWSTASSSARSVSISAPMISRSQGTKARQQPRQRRWCWPCLPKWP